MKLNLLFFVRLFIRHLRVLVAIPLAMAVLVALFTQNQPEVYTSRATVYTGISTSSGIELENTRIDYMGVGIAYGNLMNLIRSRSTLETVGLKLLAQHLSLEQGNTRIISEARQEQLSDAIPAEIRALAVPGDAAGTYLNFLEYLESDPGNPLYQLLHKDHPDYGIGPIGSRLRITRQPNSDFLDIQYDSEDPAICQNTLLLLCEVFVRQNTELRVNQSDAVVEYFEGQLGNSTTRLKEAEEELLQFNKSNNIINYYEQTKHIAAEKEEFEIKYFQVQREFSGAKGVLNNLESKLKTHEKKRLASQQVQALRQELSDLNFQVGLRSLGLEQDSASQAQNAAFIRGKQKEIKAVTRALNAQVDTLFTADYDVKGLASTTILDDWLKETIAYENAKAQLEVMEEKRREFDRLYQVFSPLGATMKRLERKIDIAEREYLSLLHSLGLAKLKQQNEELMSNIKLSEVPFFPISPEPSKRLLLVAVAAIAGFMLVALAILALEFLDSNLANTRRASQRVGMEVSSIFPVIAPDDPRIDYEFLRNRAVNAIARKLILNRSRMAGIGQPLLSLFVSTQEGEGKSYICHNLIASLCELEYRVLHISYDSPHGKQEASNYMHLPYTVNDRLYRTASLEDFGTREAGIDAGKFDFVLVELPGLIKNPFPVNLIGRAQQLFLVTRANRAWSEADQHALEQFRGATDGPAPLLLLNGVDVLEMETVLGELPKKRSRLRQWVKGLVQLQFFNNKSIA